MKEFWNERYAQEAFVYGEEPNLFFAQQISQLNPGSILLPAEGEGRNAVFAAGRGWLVEAFDISIEGKKKAERLAQKNKVEISYQIASLQEINFESAVFDALGLVFAHFPTAVKLTYFKKLQDYLKPGATVILEGFSKDQLRYSSENPRVGGPKDIDLLYSIEEITRIFSGFETLILSEEEVELKEGDFHVGKSSVVRYVGRKS